MGWSSIQGTPTRSSDAGKRGPAKAPIMPQAAAALMTLRRRWPMPRNRRRDYEVGYGKPPRHTQFEKGQSGNPRGRPSGSKNLATLVNEALNETVIVVENGRRRTIPQREAFAKQVVNRSTKADWRAAKILLDIAPDVESQSALETVESSFSAEDDKVIEQIKARLNSKKGDSDA